MEKKFNALGHQVDIAPAVPKETREEDTFTRMLAVRTERRAIGGKELDAAISTLSKYKDGKGNLERRIVDDEQWYRLRHQELLRRQQASKLPDPTSAWLFDALNNKHADAMDNYPEPAVLPRERSDQETARQLSSVVPVIIERNEFEGTYSDNWWEKLKHGTAVYGVFWDKDLDGGLGDVAIRDVDLLNIFWEPGVRDVQKSRNLFVVDLRDRDLLEQQYPELAGKLGGNAIDLTEYVYDDTVDTSDKVAVVDWYYKVKGANGRTLLHYAKFVGRTLLFASENDEQYTERGFYDHGKYPFVFDTLFPEKGTPVGFGYIAVTKDPQMYIDRLGGDILRHADALANPRYFAWTQCGINEKEFLDPGQKIVHVEGASIDESRLKPIEVQALPGVVVDVMQMKINELKETASNRDYNSGGTTSGVTAAAAIAALQEAGNKTSRDMIAASYRAYTKIVSLVIDLMRQFYDESRSFRVTAPNGYDFIDFSNQGMVDQPMQSLGSELAVRRPIFDISIKAQKQSPFSQLSQNETAKEMYAMGFFAPDKAQEAQIALEMMEFEGKDKVAEKVKEGQTLMNIVQKLFAQMEQMGTQLAILTGSPQMRPTGAPARGEAPPIAGQVGSPQGGRGADPMAKAAQTAQTAKTPYMERLADNAKVSM